MYCKVRPHNKNSGNAAIGAPFVETGDKQHLTYGDIS